ncbi:hypothetical protein ACWELJ_21245 [Nocardia sp. NPDC004582]
MTVGLAAVALISFALTAAFILSGHRALERQDLALRERERRLGRPLTPNEVWRINLGLEQPLPSPVRTDPEPEQ